MPIGDGSAWDETNPTNSTLATSIDDYDRDLRVGVRSRMSLEHEWPSSQSATNQAGQHKFVTLQNQSAKPTVSGTQLAAVYTKTQGSGLQELFWENEAGTEVQLTNRSNPNPASGSVIQVVNGQSASVVTVNSVLAQDNSVPLDAETVQVTTLSITPSNASNKIYLKGKVTGAASGAATIMGLCIFNGTTCVSVDWNQSFSTSAENSEVEHYMTAGTTGAITFYLKAGVSGNTYYVNGDGSGTRIGGGAAYANLTAMEIKA